MPGHVPIEEEEVVDPGCGRTAASRWLAAGQPGGLLDRPGRVHEQVARMRTRHAPPSAGVGPRGDRAL